MAMVMVALVFVRRRGQARFLSDMRGGRNCMKDVDLGVTYFYHSTDKNALEKSEYYTLYVQVVQR